LISTIYGLLRPQNPISRLTATEARSSLPVDFDEDQPQPLWIVRRGRCERSRAACRD